jgi:hypothetical protein
MSTWLINDQTPESLGLEVVGGTFRSGSASSVQLRCIRAYDAADLFTYNATVTIKRDDVKFFVGKVRAVPKSASAEHEGHDYIVEDAWAEMERTVYQEPWSVSDASVLMPRCFLGVNAAGERINVGEQIGEALDFAVGSGVSIAKGSVPDGMLLWPTEVDGMSIAEVIRTSLRYHPDWIAWIDHTTTVPTFNVTLRASADAMSLACTDCEDFDIADLQDRLPDVVRIVFVTATEVDGEVYRNVSVQKFPTGGADSGPGVMSVTVDLQGVRASINKQQVQTRHIPTTLADSTLSAKAWLKLKYPVIKDISDDKLDLGEWERAVVPETEEQPEPINPAATRLAGTTTTHLPRELVKGSIFEWMRKRIGQVRVSWTLEAGPGATEDEIERIAKVPKGVTVRATNAITKIYKGLASWSPPEDAPAGIAASYYNTIRNGCRYEGSVSLITSDLTGRWHGKKLNITGGAAAWATMAAPIHSVRWDAQSERASISFGPTPEFAFHDYHEYLKLLRKRPVTWISTAERTSNELGDELGPSAAGDNIGPMDVPGDIPEPLGGEAPPAPLTLKGGTAVNKVALVPGFINGVELAPAEHTATATHYYWLKIVATYGTPDSYVVTREITTTIDPPSGATITGSGFTSYRLIGRAVVTGGAAAITNYSNGGNLGVDSFGSIVFWWLA